MTAPMADPSQNKNLSSPTVRETGTISPSPARTNFEHDAGARSGGSKSKFLVVVILTAATVASALGAAAFGARYAIINWRILSSARRELYDLEKRHRAISEAAGDMRRLEPELKFINSILVNPVEPLPFIESIESLGRKTGVEVELSLISGPDNTQNYMLAATGEFSKIMSFFKNLESLPFWFELQDSGISAISEKEKEKSPAAKSERSVRFNTILRPFSP